MPFDEDGRFVPEPDTASLPVLIGTAAWGVALVGVLMASALDAPARPWIGVCVVGLVSGMGGLGYLRWRRQRASRPSV